MLMFQHLPVVSSLGDVSDVSALSLPCLLGCWGLGGDQPSPAQSSPAQTGQGPDQDTSWHRTRDVTGSRIARKVLLQYCLSIDQQSIIVHLMFLHYLKKKSFNSDGRKRMTETGDAKRNSTKTPAHALHQDVATAWYVLRQISQL